jgi:peptide/nickel transport system ATP-binding protein
VSAPLIQLEAVAKRFVKRPDAAAKVANWFGAGVREEVVRAVDGVDLAVGEGEVLGLVGESGCGKSTIGRIVAGILPPTAGTVRFRGTAVDQLGTEARRQAMLKVQMIFQDPFASLNPRMKVREIIGEAPVVHGLVARDQADDYVAAIMRQVGLDPSYRDRYPHQFSGGQRQRIGIARAIAVKPDFIVCDEAVAALDVSIQAQVLNLFMDLRRELGLTYLFISHDLGVVEHLSDRVAIMYLGRIVESARTEDLFSSPNHPYTRALLDGVPRLGKRRHSFQPVKGEIPSALNPPTGCHFHPRCPHAMPRCKTDAPTLREIVPGRLSACHLNDQLPLPSGEGARAARG